MLHINQLFTSHHSLLTSHHSLLHLTSHFLHLTSHLSYLTFHTKKRTCYTGKHKCNKQEWGLGNFLLTLQPETELRYENERRKTKNERRKTKDEKRKTKTRTKTIIHEKILCMPYGLFLRCFVLGTGCYAFAYIAC